MAIISFFLLFIWALAIHAVPLQSRAVSDGLLSQLKFFEQYSAAAYCESNHIPNSPKSITCQSGNCALVESAGATSVAEFQDQGRADATGFVAVDDKNRLIVISFRGTHSVRNFLADVDLFKTSTSICSGCRVHGGFLDSWVASKDDVLAGLQTAKAQHPDYSVVATGHSLGGSVATLAAAELRQSGYNVALYTYGSPMVGNDAFANFVTKQSGGNYRVTHADDVVPKLPGYLIGYRHVSPEYWITTDSFVTVNTGDVQSSSGILDLAGNAGTLDPSIADHLFYFNEIAACAPDKIEWK